MYISRMLLAALQEKMFQGKAIILAGARQVGKTTLVQELVTQFDNKKVISFNCDDPDDAEQLSGKGLLHLQGLLGDADIIFIDEAQKIPTIGNTVKLLVDYYKEKKQCIVTGSSSIHLFDNVNETLTGRKWTFFLYPIAYEEIANATTIKHADQRIEQFLLYGMYPEILSADSFSTKEALLKELVASQLYKDILEFQTIRNPLVLRKLLKALALQIGSLVSFNELAGLLGIDKKTVEHYIDLLEKNFILFRLPAYSTNKRKELSKSQKIYFWDVGVRNGLLKDFREQEVRSDRGALWENFIIAERLKYAAYHHLSTTPYYWRSRQGAEIDFIEESAASLAAYEIKWSKHAKRPPVLFQKLYPQASFTTATRTSYLPLLTRQP